MIKVCRQLWLISCASLFFVCTIFSNDLDAAISNRYCDSKPDQHHIGFSSEKLQNAYLDTGSEVGFSRGELSTGMIANDEKTHSLAIDLNFQYTIISFDNSIEPMTNGHLHSWDLPVSWRSKSAEHTIDYYLAPVISVSSNGLKNPDLLDSDSIQLWTGMLYKKEYGHSGAWLLGFRSDHRFGPYRVYPVVGFCWRPDENWQLQLALPDFSIRRFFSNGIIIKLFAEPDGNKWHVFSKDETTDSDFTYSAIVAGLSIEWQINSTVWLEFSAVRHSNRQFIFALDDGTLLDTDARSSAGLTVTAGVLF